MCGDCDAIFPRKDSLTRHKLMHAMSQEERRDLKSVYEISHEKEVNPNHREIINKFEMSMMKLHEKFAVPITPKLHIVFEHLSEYFEMSGKTLRKKTDQTVEATHSKFDNFIRAHNYKIRDVESEKAGEYLLKAVKHFNSYNLGKID